MPWEHDHEPVYLGYPIFWRNLIWVSCDLPKTGMVWTPELPSSKFNIEPAIYTWNMLEKTRCHWKNMGSFCLCLDNLPEFTVIYHTFPYFSICSKHNLISSTINRHREAPISRLLSQILTLHTPASMARPRWRRFLRPQANSCCLLSLWLITQANWSNCIIRNWLVVWKVLWKIGKSILGWFLYPIYGKILKMATKPPTRISLDISN